MTSRQSPARASASVSGLTKASPIVLGHMPIRMSFVVLAQKASRSGFNTWIMSPQGRGLRHQGHGPGALASRDQVRGRTGPGQSSREAARVVLTIAGHVCRPHGLSLRGRRPDRCGAHRGCAVGVLADLEHRSMEGDHRHRHWRLNQGTRRGMDQRTVFLTILAMAAATYLPLIHDSPYLFARIESGTAPRKE